MMKDVERMIDDVIRKFGFEARQTINFCRMCERENINRVEKRYNELMSCY